MDRRDERSPTAGWITFGIVLTILTVLPVPNFLLPLTAFFIVGWKWQAVGVFLAAIPISIISHLRRIEVADNLGFSRPEPIDTILPAMAAFYLIWGIVALLAAYVRWLRA